ncbi:MAG: large subunit ribosomal protein [Thermomicrobiales bacterium]|nr:large subunit ribosomal protein [Thermomicrobiales bacterium]MEA2526281.1 large subunit ribosomal protein [Thermomicrobiales bacterium]MEA2530794.1 large subunit ribosomal protein [Thermomicrobiales bacterium]MEA2584497.1 large subunit ribosomal protein [Thermomicrobiales bacterium]MEA2596736.1 large subunit ribosomal protein [Thermomicrobiales bacterium]
MTKQKLKTHKGAKRRFKITATGKVMRAKGMKSHFRRRKAPRVLRQLDRMLELDQTDEKRVKRMLPYGS